jgi:GalNAc-alpha-(1->4)-GalNAc-alpha-(1->3)-diNAcBac-PP-undecaprenol alpha-1,4-N-acetyl-D-galactosaminyltransferase
VERCAVLLAEGFIQLSHQVSLITISGKERDFYSVPENVSRVTLEMDKSSKGALDGLISNIKRVTKLRKAIKAINPDVIISFLPEANIVTLLASKGLNLCKIICEQNDPVLSMDSKSLKGKVWLWLRKLTYPKCTQLVSSSLGVDHHFTWLNVEKRSVIYNPLAVDDSRTEDTIGKTVGKKRLVAMGRLTHQKGFDILLPAFKKALEKCNDWELVILGEGELRSELENQISSLGLNEVVKLPGRLTNPFPVLKNSDLFVLSSRYEGFGNVIIEAMASGLPVVSTDCPSGPSEIISHGVSGLLLKPECVDSLANGLVELMQDQSKRELFASRTPEVIEKFKLNVIVNEWEDLIFEFAT